MTRTLILLAFGIILLTLAVRSLRHQRLKVRYVLLFFFVGLPFLALAAWPDGVLFLANTLKIEKPTVMILFVTTFMILMIFKLLSIVSAQERRINALAQIAGILLQEHRFRADSADDRPPPAQTSSQ